MKRIFKVATRAITVTLIFLLPFQEAADAQEFKIRGRLHMDGFYGIHNALQFSNGFNNRRARLGMDGLIDDNWDGRIEIDFADGGISPNDFRLRRSFENGGRLWIGQFKVPQGLNELTSSNEITFIERSTPSNVITDSRRMGIAYEQFGSNLGFKSMIFGRALGGRGSMTDDMPIGIAFRGVYSPELAGGLLHIGTSVAYEDLMETNPAGYSDRPECRDSKGGSVRFINAQVNEVKSTFKSGLELLYMNGPFSVEGEYLQVNVIRKQDAGDNPKFFGWHLQTSYVLTGESRSYSKGITGGVTPAGESGAWEIALRYSFTDLNNAGFTGGKQKNITLGVNRYVTQKLRFMGNVIFVNFANLESNEKPVLGALRAQYNF